MRIALFVLAACLALLSASAAQARFCLGSDERLIIMQKLDMRSPENQPLALARLLRMECMLLPYAISDAGYVLAVNGGPDYYTMTAEEIAEFQSTRGLPKAMPVFAMSTADWILGHLFWFGLPLVALAGSMIWLLAMPARRPQPLRKVRPRPTGRVR